MLDELSLAATSSRPLERQRRAHRARVSVVYAYTPNTMRLQSILRHVQPIPGFVYGHVELVNRGVAAQLQVHVRPRQSCRAVCSGCGKKRPGYDTLGERRFSFVPLWGMMVILLYTMRRVNCRRCGVTVVVTITPGSTRLAPRRSMPPSP